MSRPRNFKLELMALILGLVWGFLLTLLGLSTMKMWEDLNWRCIEYSPINGKCVVLEHKDRIHE